MTDQNRIEPRINDEVTKRKLEDMDRVEDVDRAGPEDTRNERPDVAAKIVQPELPRPLQSATEARPAADPTQVIVTAGATAHSVQVHHPGIPELHSHGESPESATLNLAQDLARQIDGAADDLHREPLQLALDDVNASIEQSA
jgi:hypothetical protein